MQQFDHTAGHGTLPQRRHTRAVSPPFPREDGAWVMLYTPILIALLAAPALNLIASLLLIASVAGAFCLQHVAGLILRRRNPERNRVWLVGCLLLLTASGLPLLLVYPLRDLLLVAGLAAIMFGVKAVLLVSSHRRFERTWWGEVFGVLALTLSGPAACVVTRGALDRMAWELWAATALYFTSGVLFVDLLLAASRSKAPLDTRAHWRLGRGHLIYHALLAGLVGYAGASMNRQAAVFFFLAYTPILVRAFRSWIQLSDAPLSFKRVGMGELLYAVWFAGFCAAWLRTM